ncbi:hypothetical protein BAE44_0023121, partial [Dichanthelium oligosanthes]
LPLRRVRACRHGHGLPLRPMQLQHPRGMLEPPAAHDVRPAPRARTHSHPPRRQPLVRRLQGDLPRRAVHVPLARRATSTCTRGARPCLPDRSGRHGETGTGPYSFSGWAYAWHI